MRKFILALFIASIAAVGFANTASASPHPGSVNCAWAKADPTCPTTQPGTPGGCTPTSFAGGGCVTDTLSFTSIHRGHNGSWNTQDPCIFHQHKGLREDSLSSTDIRGCHCQVVKILRSKIVCHKEVWYWTTEVICRGHHRDPHHCGCQAGGQVALGVSRIA